MTEADDAGLLACPFCGKRPLIIPVGDTVQIACETMSCNVQPFTDSDEYAEVARRWNTRTPSHSQDAGSVVRAKLLARDIFADDRRIIEYNAGGGSWRNSYLRDHLSKRDSKITDFFDALAVPRPIAGREGIAQVLAQFDGHFWENITDNHKNIYRGRTDAILTPSPSAEPVAWRVKNDAGHWYTTADQVLANHWRNAEKLNVDPLYATLPVSDASREAHPFSTEVAMQAALTIAISQIKHMAAWITKQNAGYSFESLGEDMPAIEAALAAALSASDKTGSAT